MLECQVRDRGGAQEEPYVGVWSAHIRSGNTRTGIGLPGLATPAQVCETPKHVLPEAEDTNSPGRGSRESDTDPFGSLILEAEESPDEKPYEQESSDNLTTFSEDESDTPELTNSASHRQNTNKPKDRPGIKIASLNMRG